MSAIDVDQLLAEAREREAVRCPHCEAIVDMTDCDIYPRHVTYWGEHDPVEQHCEKCEKTFFLKEIVIRRWAAGKTMREAIDD